MNASVFSILFERVQFLNEKLSSTVGFTCFLWMLLHAEGTTGSAAVRNYGKLYNK
jgi:hypothetical protein